MTPRKSFCGLPWPPLGNPRPLWLLYHHCHRIYEWKSGKRWMGLKEGEMYFEPMNELYETTRFENEKTIIPFYCTLFSFFLSFLSLWGWKFHRLALCRLTLGEEEGTTIFPWKRHKKKQKGFPFMEKCIYSGDLEKRGVSLPECLLDNPGNSYREKEVRSPNLWQWTL